MKNFILISLCLLLTAQSIAMETLSRAEISAETNSTFYQACENGPFERFYKLLHETKVNIHETNHNGWTPLHMCVVHGDYKKVKAFIEKYGYTDAQDNQGCTALFLAAVVGNEDITELLLTSGAQVNTFTQEGRTPLEEALSNGHETIAKMLLAKGATIVLPDFSGNTPGHVARENSLTDSINLLETESLSVINSSSAQNAEGDSSVPTPHSLLATNDLSFSSQGASNESSFGSYNKETFKQFSSSANEQGNNLLFSNRQEKPYSPSLKDSALHVDNILRDQNVAEQEQLRQQEREQLKSAQELERITKERKQQIVLDAFVLHEKIFRPLEEERFAELQLRLQEREQLKRAQELERTTTARKQQIVQDSLALHEKTIRQLEDEGERFAELQLRLQEREQLKRTQEQERITTARKQLEQEALALHEKTVRQLEEERLARLRDYSKK